MIILIEATTTSGEKRGEFFHFIFELNSDTKISRSTLA